MSSDVLENWMTNLPSVTRDLPIINIAIPGSHDSMSYGIKTGATTAADATPTIKAFNKVVPCIVKNWAVTQHLCVEKQLKAGIRYFDLRICKNDTDLKFYFVHSLYANEIMGPLYAIKQFLDNHRNEIVILDFQHFYNFNQNDSIKLVHMLLKIFDKTICGPIVGDLNQCTLNRLSQNGYQTIIIYRLQNIISNFLWPSNIWSTPWPNQTNILKLKDYLEQSIKSDRAYGTGFVTQCVLTPTTDFIVPRIWSSLEKSCASVVSKKLSKWIGEQTPGAYLSDEQPTFNVFIADFVDINENAFSKIVVNLNNKITL